MRAHLFAAAALSLGLAACESTAYVNPCYGAGMLIPTEATGDEIVTAADQCIADGGERKQGLTIRSAGHLRLQNYDAAIADADAAIQLDPGYADAYYYRGFAHEEAGHTAEAERDFDLAIKAGLQPGIAFRAAGRLKFVGGDYAGAYDDFAAIVKADPDDAEAWRLLGAAAAVLERFDVAEQDFTKALTLNPEDHKAFSGRGYVRYFTSRYAEAAADLKVALEAKPEGLKAAFLYLAMVRAHDPDAIPELERQAETLNASTNPGVFPAFFLGRIDEAGMVAIAINTGIHKPRENESEGYFYAGMARLLAGDTAGAKMWFEKTMATGVVRFDEIRGARKELRAMGIDVPSPDPAVAAARSLRLAPAGS
jgi:tetratricopeptide (TPR) repeat protein